MVALFIVLLVCMAMFLFGSYHGIVNGSVLGVWIVGISLFVTFVAIAGFKMFAQ